MPNSESPIIQFEELNLIDDVLKLVWEKVYSIDIVRTDSLEKQVNDNPTPLGLDQAGRKGAEYLQIQTQWGYVILVPIGLLRLWCRAGGSTNG